MTSHDRSPPIRDFLDPFHLDLRTDKTQAQWRGVHGSEGSIASIVKKRKEKNAYINNSI
jgi:hypothetical protein